MRPNQMEFIILLLFRLSDKKKVTTPECKHVAFSVLQWQFWNTKNENEIIQIVVHYCYTLSE